MLTPICGRLKTISLTDKKPIRLAFSLIEYLRLKYQDNANNANLQDNDVTDKSLALFSSIPYQTEDYERN